MVGGRARDLISSARRWTSASMGPFGFSGSGAGAAKWKCYMTDMETPHDEMETLHMTFANAPCPKQNAA